MTNYTRRHTFLIITHKNNCCQVFSRRRNDQPFLVNEYEVKVGWQSSSLKNKFSGFRRAKHKHIFSKSKPYSTTSYEHVSILTLGNFLSFTERIFIQTRRLWRVSANISVCYCVARYENFAVNGKASIFVSYVIKEFAHAFSCAYMYIEARVALGCASSYSYASLVLSKLPACIHNSIDMYAR